MSTLPLTARPRLTATPPLTTRSLPRPRAAAPSAAEPSEAASILGARLRLVPSGDGYALTRRDGEFVFAAPGRSGRQLCLEFAQSAGVAALGR